MRFHADLHIHSKYSRATSRDLDLEHLAAWAGRKGIAVVATGDFTHPAWRAELKEKLVPAAPGLFRLRAEIEREVLRELPAACRTLPQFMLAVEISTIYKKGDRTRKVHHLIYAPDFDTADRCSAALARIGNIASDGRPILGLDSRHLLEIALASGPGAYLVPAHIWTPWFAALGSMSGFDSIAECYGDLADHIFAVETGLSSDPAMNWRLSQLDRYRLVSNSDAHSPGKLGREATTFDCDVDYYAIRAALETGNGYVGTVEFFPEEGKYHLDGHRKCGMRQTPRETLAHGGRCPVCGQATTVGVLHRVEALADRREEEVRPPATAGEVSNFVPLPELIGEIAGSGPGSKTVGRHYDRLLSTLGAELPILGAVPIEDIARTTSSLFAEAITRLRAGQVFRESGYDGEYGVIRLFEASELRRLTAGGLLFEGGSGGASEPGRREPTPHGAPAPAATASANPVEPSGTPRAPIARGRRTAVDVVVSGDLLLALDANAATVAATAAVADADAVGDAVVVAADAAAVAATDTDEGTLATIVDRQPAGAGSDSTADSDSDFGDRAPRDLLAGLDADQRAAAEAVDGPVAIVAGPGSGKTRTLTYRIAHLIAACGAPPTACLAVTFTRRAAAEMRERLAVLLPAAAGAERAAADAVPIHTFHSLGLAILREHYAAVGLPEDFRVADDAEQVTLLRDALGLSAPRAKTLLRAISKAKRTQRTLRDEDETATVAGPPGADATSAADATSGSDAAPGADAVLDRDAASVGGGRRDAVPHLGDAAPISTAVRTAEGEAARPAMDLRVAMVAYREALTVRGCIDFDDLVGLALQLLADNAMIASAYRDRFRWISVDEFQDVDEQQYQLIRVLAPPDAVASATPASPMPARPAVSNAATPAPEPLQGPTPEATPGPTPGPHTARRTWPDTVPPTARPIPPHANLCVIGDPNQAIYGFRGADASCFDRFLQDYPDAVRVALTRNYRSTGTIVTASTQMLSSGFDTNQPLAEIVRDMHERITIQVAPTDRAEADLIVQAVESLIGGLSLDPGRASRPSSSAIGFADVAVLYRTGAQAAVLCDAFARSGIPFATHGHDSLLEDAAVRALLDALDTPDAVALSDARGPSDVRGPSDSPDPLDTSDASPRPSAAPPAPPAPLAPRAPRSLSGRLRDAADRLAVQADAPGVAARDQALHRLLSIAETCGDDHARFADALPLAIEADFWDPRADRVSLLTLHAAKGLEFPVVFIAGLEDGILPLAWQPQLDDKAAAEERRLFYVGMTRAQDRLILTRALERMWRGRLRALNASPFLDAIEQELVKHQQAAPARVRPDDRQLRLL